MDFYDARSKIIIKNRIVLDKLLAERAIESLIRPPSPSGSSNVPLSTHIALPGPIRGENRDQSSPEKRILRSTSATVSGDASALFPRPASRPESYRVKLLLTIPHTVSSLVSLSAIFDAFLFTLIQQSPSLELRNVISASCDSQYSFLQYAN